MNNAHESSPAPAPGRTPPSQAAAPAAPASVPVPEPAPASQAAAPGAATPAPAPVPERPLRARLLRSGAAALAALAALTALFYLEENWRGGSAWETAQQQLAVKQEKLDWAAYIPPAAPDDQNFFKAPKMQDWFAGGGSNELLARLSLDSFAELGWHRVHSNASVMVAELILRPPDTAGPPSGAAVPAAEVVPLISLDNASLSAAIRRLADQAHLQVDLDPQVLSNRPGPLTRSAATWTNVSAMSVLMALLCDNNLRWVDDPQTGRALIKDAELTGASGAGDAVNRDFVMAIIRNAIGPVGEIADGFPLSANTLRENPPQRLSIAPDSVPTQNELARLFPAAHAFRIEPSGNSLRVFLNLVPVAAADYLAWSDQFSPEFETIRAAVKRPFARLDGDYNRPYLVPVPNMPAVNEVASRLASRTAAFLMLGKPADALRELTLLNDLRGCLEGKPAGRPIMWSTAMANVTISDLYAQTISYGLRLQVWNDSQLAALEDQLRQVDLVSQLWCALESERAADCSMLDGGFRSETAHLFRIGGVNRSFWHKITSPPRLALKFMPGGWVCRNLAHLAALDQEMIDSVDRPMGVIRPHQVEAARDRIAADLRLHGRSFFWFLAKNMVFSASAPLKTTAQAQTAVNQALVVCALERCRLALREYPAALRDLVPQFIRTIPSDPVNGEPLKYRLEAPGRFVLYSIGWDEKDDNGAPLNAEGKGDWVWGR